MKHINLSNYKGSITDWTELNYINGGLADNLADIANIKVNDSCYNYLAKSVNLFDNTNTKLVNSTFNASNQTLFSYGGFALKVFNLTIGQTYTITSTKTMLLGETNDLTNSGTVSTGANYSFTATTNYLLITNHSANEYEEIFKNLMIVQGSTAPTAYEPYGALVIHQNANKVNLGYFNWGYNPTSGKERFYTNLNDIKVPASNTSLANISISTNYENVPYDTLANTDIDKIMAVGLSQNVIIRDFTYTDTEAFKAAMKGVMLKYELATPKTIVLKSVDLGTLGWTGANGFFQVPFAVAKQPSSTAVTATWLSCSLYKPDCADHIYANVNDKRIGLNPDNSFLQVRDNSYKNVTLFKAAMSGVILLYEPKTTTTASTLAMSNKLSENASKSANFEDFNEAISTDEETSKN